MPLILAESKTATEDTTLSPLTHVVARSLVLVATCQSIQSTQSDLLLSDFFVAIYLYAAALPSEWISDTDVNIWSTDYKIRTQVTWHSYRGEPLWTQFVVCLTQNRCQREWTELMDAYTCMCIVRLRRPETMDLTIRGLLRTYPNPNPNFNTNRSGCCRPRESWKMGMATRYRSLGGVKFRSRLQQVKKFLKTHFWIA